ncbi:MAG: hypothetical protein NWF05_04270 [Candidatus Bathyarchaeota archaeon]|nr:hypothetical protein [Candidatus Bathyarchaeota archaeon]
MRRKFGLALIALLASYAVTVSLLLGAFSPDLVSQTKPPLVTFNWETLQTNAAQGGSVNINCTVFNTSYNQSAKTGFRVLLAAINNETYWYNCSLWKDIFTRSFTPEMLLLGPREQQTVTLTLTLASDAPVGTYSFALQGFRNNLKLNVTPTRI